MAQQSLHRPKMVRTGCLLERRRQPQASCLRTALYQNLKPARFEATGLPSHNGTRLPWNFGIDMRIDKSFKIGGVEGGGPFCQCLSPCRECVRCTKYRWRVCCIGSPYDDGFLATAEISSIKTLTDSGRGDDVDNIYFLSMGLPISLRCRIDVFRCHVRILETIFNAHNFIIHKSE
jgi:hypothetical protein